jgi:hypothetical protein
LEAERAEDEAREAGERTRLVKQEARDMRMAAKLAKEKAEKAKRREQEATPLPLPLIKVIQKEDQGGIYLNAPLIEGDAGI